MIVEYTLEADGTIPTYIAEGGYFYKANDKASPQDWDIVGHTVSDDVPENLTVLNRDELITRVTNLGYKQRRAFDAPGSSYHTDTLLTNEEIESLVDDFISRAP